MIGASAENAHPFMYKVDGSHLTKASTANPMDVPGQPLCVDIARVGLRARQKPRTEAQLIARSAVLHGSGSKTPIPCSRVLASNPVKPLSRSTLARPVPTEHRRPAGRRNPWCAPRTINRAVQAGSSEGLGT